MGRDGPDQFGAGALRGGGGLLPVRRGPVLLGRRVDQPGQTVGEALLGQRVPLQTDQHPDGTLLAPLVLLLRPVRPRRAARRELPVRAGLLQGVLEGECLALGERALHGGVGIRHATLGQRGHEPRQLQRRVPGQGRLLQEPDGDGTAAPLVVRAALRAEQRPGEPVGLLRPHPADPEQLPGVRPQRLLRALTEERGRLRRERFGGAPLGQYPPHRLHGLRCRSGGTGGRGGRLGGRRPGRSYRLGCGAARGLGGSEDGGRRLLTALHGTHGGEQVGRRAAELAPGVDRPLLLGLPPLDPLPLEPLRRQLGVDLGDLCGRLALALAPGVRPLPGGLDRPGAGVGPGIGRLRLALRPDGLPGGLRRGRRRVARGLRPGVHGVRGVLGDGLGLRAHSVLQS
ncbi:hypothetical protein B0E38_03731 [Streptomyces sp. 111WW2]|nr:hypothetical protein B0E38_03731 [Streptomyces sp. 111WW2]